MMSGESSKLIEHHLTAHQLIKVNSTADRPANKIKMPLYIATILFLMAFAVGSDATADPGPVVLTSPPIRIVGGHDFYTSAVVSNFQITLTPIKTAKGTPGTKWQMKYTYYNGS